MIYLGTCNRQHYCYNIKKKMFYRYTVEITPNDISYYASKYISTTWWYDSVASYDNIKYVPLDKIIIDYQDISTLENILLSKILNSL